MLTSPAFWLFVAVLCICAGGFYYIALDHRAGKRPGGDLGGLALEDAAAAGRAARAGSAAMGRVAWAGTRAAGRAGRGVWNWVKKPRRRRPAEGAGGFDFGGWWNSRSRAVEGRGEFDLAVVGTSHYQDALERVCGGRSAERASKVVKVLLVHEDANPYDDKAIRVDIRGRPVGHLSRSDARAYRGRLAAEGRAGMDLECRGKVVGGWDRGGHDRGSFGVRLDLSV